MPSSVESIFVAAGLRPGGVVAWGSAIDVDEPGVYIVALDDDPKTLNRCLSEAPIADGALEHLLVVRPEARVDGATPTKRELRERLQRFWLPDETILYIGLASQSIRSRVDAYYRTKLGARSPHAGGWFLKTLEPIPARYVHWASAPDPSGAEDAMLRSFCAGISDATRSSLHDPERPFPFANLEWPPGTRKRHGITGAKAARRTATTRSLQREALSDSDRSPFRVDGQRNRSVPERHLQSQNVTSADLERNQIRIPSRAKGFFPATKQHISIRLRGRPVEASWDPRVGPDRERSGVIRFRKADLFGVTAGTVFTVQRAPTGQVELR